MIRPARLLIALAVLSVCAWLGDVGEVDPLTPRDASPVPSTVLRPKEARVGENVRTIASPVDEWDRHSWSVRLDDRSPGLAVLAPMPLSGSNFAVRPGPRGEAIPLEITAFRGQVFLPDRGMASLILLQSDEALAGTIHVPNEGRLFFTRKAGEPAWTARWENTGAAACCTLEGNRARLEPMPTQSAMPAKPVAFALEKAERTGVDPATDLPDRFLHPPPFGKAYEASLRDLALLLVLDKRATGEQETNHLVDVVLGRLVSVAEMAAVYENQLGIRVRVQEIVLIPDDPAYEDIPSESPLADFRAWLRERRPRQDHGWAAAVKWGRGLGSQTLGLAYVASVGTDDAVGVLSSSSGWSTLAHEVGHILGAGHAEGGLMNGIVAQENGHSFFTEDLITGKTAARVIYEHARDRLPGEGVLRHPREIPFARPDFRRTGAGRALAFDPRVNDQRSVPQGFVNAAIAVDEAGLVEPAGSGAVAVLPDKVLFTPAPGFEGLAQFSYTLRGSLGNEGDGWLHKADVAVLVGEFDDDPTRLVLAPGERRGVYPPNDAMLSRIVQPEQARVIISPDDPRLFIIRVSESAAGEDAFEAGGRRYQIIYQPVAPEGGTDRLVHHSALGDLRVWPLANDRGVASRWAVPDQATVGDGQLALEGGSRRLLSAENLTPTLGTLFLPRHAASSTESGDGRLTGEIRLSPVPGATGEVRIRYHFEDGEGRQGEGELRIHLEGGSTLLTGDGHVLRYLVPRSPEAAATWMLPAFPVTSWGRGQLPVGYEVPGGGPGAIATDVRGVMEHVNASIYLRMPFEVVDPDAVEALALRIRSDDGFVAYLNGVEIVRRRAPERLNWRSAATESARADEILSLEAAAALLRRGDNILAIHGLNATAGDSDFLVRPELRAIRPLRLARLAEPARSFLRVRPGQGIVLRSETDLPDDSSFFAGTIDARWVLASAPAGAQVRLEQIAETGEAYLHLGSPGRHRLVLIGRDAGGSETRQEVLLEAGDGSDPGVTGLAVDAGADVATEALTVELEGGIDRSPQATIESVAWSRRSGPGEVRFENDASERTLATFSRAGVYRLRLAVRGMGATTFDDVMVRVRVREREWVSPSGEGRYFVPVDGRVDERWREPAFRDEGWKIARGGIGFDSSGAFAPQIDTDVEGSMRFRSGSLYLRYAFDVFDPASVDRLTLAFQVDDGAVVYLNGTEVARRRAPVSPLDWSSLATAFAGETTLLKNWETFDLSEYRGRLLRGKNVLAVHGLNYQADSSDFLLRVRLAGTIAESPLERTFEAWLDSAGAKAGDPRGSFADPDRDGLTHFLEFALGTAPFEVSRWPLALDFQDGELSLIFEQRSDLEALGMRVDVESSPSLETDSWSVWNAESRRVLGIDPGRERVLLAGALAEGTRYFRLRLGF